MRHKMYDIIIKWFAIITSCAVVGLFIAWLVLNFLAGCVDWSQPNCIKPGIFIADLTR